MTLWFYSDIPFWVAFQVGLVKPKFEKIHMDIADSFARMNITEFRVYVET